MDAAHVDRSTQDLAQATGRRNAVHSLGTRGLALLAALGLADASAKESRKGDKAEVQADGKGKKKRKKKHGPTGSAGPTGPAGPAGVAEFKTRLVISEQSAGLGPEKGNQVTGFAECGAEGKVVSCGYLRGGGAAQLVNVFVFGVGPDAARSSCFASLVRTTEVGSVAGATIKATAICLE